VANSNNTDENGRFKDVSSKEIKDTIENDKARRLEVFKRTPPPPVKEKVKKTRRKKNYVEKAPNRKALRATLGIGARTRRRRAPREATAKDIRRAGVRSLRGGNKRFARFINARYGAKAIAKYNDYAGRLRRSIRLRRQVVEIDANTFRVRKYIVRTDTNGENPYSCTCPDFSQFTSEESRDWFGSNAGPFNPCKHMMAVRDRDRGGKWLCLNGVCTLDPNATEGFFTKAECEASRYVDLLEGGQCDTLYNISFISDVFNSVGSYVTTISDSYLTNTSLANLRGPIRTSYPWVDTFSGTVIWRLFHKCGTVDLGGVPNTDWRRNAVIIAERVDGLADNCGSPTILCAGVVGGCTNPSSPNYDEYATVDDGSCGVSGCTDPLAPNYNPDATCDDGSCDPYTPGCTDPAANNYNPSATVDDGSCTYDVLGCTDPLATNYDPAANVDDGSCTY
jgi:hypothetical protein